MLKVVLIYKKKWTQNGQQGLEINSMSGKE